MSKRTWLPLVLLAAALVTLTALTFTAAADKRPADWPGFRGPNSDGISSETGLLTRWPADGPERLWQVPLGSGFSGLTVVDGRLFTLYGRDGKEHVGAFDAATGKRLWEVAIDQEREDNFGDGPRSTPLVEDGVLYAAGALGRLVALKAADGSEVWSHKLQQELGARVPTWGVAASPAIVGDLLLFNVGGSQGRSLAAFDKRTGKVKWTAEDDIAGYSTPITFTAGGVRQTVFFTGTQLIAVAPATGETLWKQPWKTEYDINAAAPIFIAPDQLFVASGYDTGAALLKITGENGKVAAREVWRSRGMKNTFSSSIYHDGYFYGFDNKNLKCIDARTGEDKWRKGGLGHGSLFYADGHLVVLSEQGELVLAKATPESYAEVASAQLAQGKHWTVPTLYDGKLYVRNEEHLTSYRFTAK